MTAISFALMALVAALVVAPAASAQSPTDAQYDPQVQLLSEGGSGGDGGQIGSLPFTGFDIAGLVAIAACLGAAGLILRRRARRGPESATQ